MSLLDNAYALITTQSRSIGTIIPDVVIEEHHLDELMITDHPAEIGATVSDHAFKKPAEVDMKIGFSNSSAGTLGWVQAAYQELLALQAQREPFDVATGKRQYRNMLIRTIAVVTDPQSEWALNVVVSLREFIIVSTQQAGGGGGGGGSAPGVGSTADQASPADTQGTQDVGAVQPQPSASSGGFATGLYDPATAAGISQLGSSDTSTPTFTQPGFNEAGSALSGANSQPQTFAPFGSGSSDFGAGATIAPQAP